MKKMIVFTGVFLCLFLTLKAQEKQPKNKIYLDIGSSYILFDYVGGPCLGLSLINEKYNFGFTVRNDYLIKLGRSYHYDTIAKAIVYSGEKIEIQDYNKLLYFDAFMSLEKHIHAPLALGIGYGWINTNYRSNIMFNPEYGYAVLTLKVDYKVSWLTFEVRGNIPIKKDYFYKYYPYDNLMPIELSAFYRFMPKKNL